MSFLESSLFNSTSTGCLVQTRTNDGAPVLAFVPNPLPPQLNIDLPLVRDLSEATHALGELAGVGRRLPNPSLLVNPFVRREAVLSSRIEGTHTSVEGLVLFEAGNQEESESDAREVLNYVRTMEQSLEMLKTVPISLSFIKEMHKLLMTGVRGEDQQPGEFRNVQNYVGERSRGIEHARFVPPPVLKMHDALHNFEDFLKNPNGFPPLIHLALAHYQFETIHPFKDGNGRIGRLLVSLLMTAPEFYQPNSILPGPLLYLSAYFEKHRREYYDHLLSVSTNGTWSEWIHFFLKGVTEQSRDAIERSQKLLNLWQEYRNKVQDASSSSRMLTLVDYLFRHPVVSVNTATKLLNVTWMSARANIRRLETMGILQEGPGRTRKKLFVAQGIISAVQ